MQGARSIKGKDSMHTYYLFPVEQQVVSECRAASKEKSGPLLLSKCQKGSSPMVVAKCRAASMERSSLVLTSEGESPRSPSIEGEGGCKFSYWDSLEISSRAFGHRYTPLGYKGLTRLAALMGYTRVCRERPGARYSGE
eukprot:scaffold133930_cov21-Tisochrysis_lutea.AAC.1